jgi:hypothetical protein
MVNDTTLQLNAEVALGNRAQQAYDVYMKDYFINFKVNLAERMYNGEILQAIHNEVIAIKALEAIILRDIETGNLATIQLNSQ